MFARKFFSLAVVLAAASSAASASRFHVVTTTDYTAALTRQIAGDKADVETLVPPGFNADLYSPRPQDLFKIHRAKLFIMIGLNLEDWARDVVDRKSTRLNSSH